MHTNEAEDVHLHFHPPQQLFILGELGLRNDLDGHLLPGLVVDPQFDHPKGAFPKELRWKLGTSLTAKQQQPT